MNPESTPCQSTMTEYMETLVKIPIPLCKPCRDFFSGEGSNKRCLHHPSAESFRQALELSCRICCFIWAKVNASHTRKLIPKETFLLLEADKPGLKPGEQELRFKIKGEPDHNFILVPQDDMSPHEFPKILSDNTGTTSAIQFCLDKYWECKTNHHFCRSLNSKHPIHPSRLIGVGSQGDEHVWLHEKSSTEFDGPYFCLSHCWGGLQPYVLTKSTSQTLQSGISTALLPKTFQDAIWVTRTFGVRYLWIDSLCIFQDDIDDWAAEASHMKEVYSQAACVIAATAANDGSEGLFYDRDPGNLGPLRLETHWVPCVERLNKSGETNKAYWLDQMHVWTHDIEKAPLIARAWVAQERHLAPRIMHFSRNQLFWECYESKANENHPTEMPEWALPTWFSRTDELKNRLCQWKIQHCNGQESVIPQPIKDPMHLRPIYFTWLQFRIAYSRCKMSKEDDKLVAITGIAQDFGSNLGDELVAGLWKSRLLEELCWMKHFRLEQNRDPMAWRAPTWSWVSTNDTVWVSSITKFHDSCAGKEIWPTLVSIDVESKLSGALIRGSISIKCKLLQCRFIRVIMSNPVYGIMLLELTKVGLEWRKNEVINNGITFNWDDDDWDRTGLVSMFIIQRCAHERTSNRDDDGSLKGDCIEGLILEKDTENHETYKRLGTFIVCGNETVEAMVQEHDASKSKIITLI